MRANTIELGSSTTSPRPRHRLDDVILVAAVRWNKGAGESVARGFGAHRRGTQAEIGGRRLGSVRRDCDTRGGEVTVALSIWRYNSGQLSLSQGAHVRGI